MRISLTAADILKLVLFSYCISTSVRAENAINPGVMKSSLVVVNVGAEEANAKVNFYNSDGFSATTVPLTVPAHGTSVVAMPVSGFTGSAGIESDQPLIAHVLNATRDNKANEIYNGAGTETEFFFPLFRHLGNTGQSSIISLQNPSTTDEAEFTAKFYDESGKQTLKLVQKLSPSMRYDIDSAKLFRKRSKTLSVHIEADKAIVGSEQIRYLRDTAAVESVLTGSSGKRYIVNPVIKLTNTANKELSWSEVFVHNLSTTPVNASINFFNQNGVSQAKLKKTIAALGFAKFDTGSIAATDFNGYAVIQGGSVAVQSLVMRSEGRRMAGYAAVNEANAGATWACTDIKDMSQTKSVNRLQVLNIGKIAESVQFEVFAPVTGNSLTKQVITVKPNHLTTLKFNSPEGISTDSVYSVLAMITGSPSAQLIATVSNEAKGTGDAGFSCQRVDTLIKN